MSSYFACSFGKQYLPLLRYSNCKGVAGFWIMGLSVTDLSATANINSCSSHDLIYIFIFRDCDIDNYGRRMVLVAANAYKDNKVYC